ncbi:MAG TPA: hypothetical protein VEU73_16375 [Gemmatimonadales bacterium]|nr:hypothetical protein [Gemmatimonadales bacterium]
MIRRILGLALLAVVVWMALQVAFSVLGVLIGLAITVLSLAAVGYVWYLALRLVSPSGAAKVRRAITGRPSSFGNPKGNEGKL